MLTSRIGGNKTAANWFSHFFFLTRAVSDNSPTNHWNTWKIMPHLLIKLSFKKRMTKTVFHIVVNLKKVYLNRKKESTEKIALRTIWKVHLCINSGATGIRFSVIQTHSEIFKLHIPGRFNNNLTKVSFNQNRLVNPEKC